MFRAAGIADGPDLMRALLVDSGHAMSTNAFPPGKLIKDPITGRVAL